MNEGKSLPARLLPTPPIPAITAYPYCFFPYLYFPHSSHEIKILLDGRDMQFKSTEPTDDLGCSTAHTFWEDCNKVCG